MYVTKNRKLLGCNSNSHVTFFDKNPVFLNKLLQFGISTLSKQFQCPESMYKWDYFCFFIMLLNKRSIKLYTSYDVSWWSVATSFHSTLILTYLLIYTDHFHSPYRADSFGKADRQNGIMTEGNSRY
jgi:hypothetical protein